MAAVEARSFDHSLIEPALRELPAAARSSASSFIGLGIAQMALGVISLFYFLSADIVTMQRVGVVLLVGGAIQAASAFSARAWTPALVDVMLSVLYVVAAVFAMRMPFESATSVVVMLSAFYIFSGVVQAVTAFSTKPVRWGVLCATGIVTFVLGVTLISRWPESTLAFVGTIAAIDMLLGGIAMFATGRVVREITDRGPTNYPHLRTPPPSTHTLV